jgi:disease resistance protein RPM1
MERQRSQDSFPEFVKDGDLVGIEDNRILLTRWLYSKELENTVITISGMGGLGKSTLVSNVYEREKISFPVHAWIVVSQTFTVDALLRKLLWKIGYTEQPLSAGIDKMDVHDLKKEIQKRLANIKYLIVLDDVWEQDIYFQIREAFENLQGSRIVITTRKDHVAGISSPTRHLELQPLSKHDAFDLFCRRAFFNQKGHMCPKDLEIIATSIVDRCHGLPLAIATIGSLLSSRQRLDIWTQKYNQLRSELSNNDHVRSIFNLSYHDLSDDLKTCFLYCSLFPEDHPMSRDSLVRLWVAEGFVLGKEKNTPEMVAEGNLMELIHRNMLEVVENDELGRVNTCKMHDIMRELAISVAKEERFASANDYGTMIQMDKDVRRLSSFGWKDNTVLKPKLPHLRTVVALGVISSSPGMLNSILSESSYLTVLELQDSEVTEVPASIGHLFNLRYIGLRRTKVKSLPDSIENLSNLHTLDIKQTKIEKLPRGIVKIRRLRHLLADRYDDEKQTQFRYFIGMQAPKDLSNMEELQTLETVESSNDLAEQLKKLMQLRSVWIDNISAVECANLFATLSSMPLLSSLLLSARDENEALCFKGLKPKSKDLRRLIIRGQWAEGTLNCPIFLGHGINLKYLALSWCHLGEDPLGMLAPYMPNLTCLRLNNMHSASTLVLYADSFPNLKTLVLKHMHDVSELKIIDGALPCIEGLYVVSLQKLDKVPQGIESLHSLKKLWLLGLHKDFRSQWLNSGMHQALQHVPEVRV